ncbi:hypothetical protein CPC735_073660 [Coccidioides posadasii C735 delta SOWgp]|uniref:Transmembrane protein 135 N-terminal domain-containing protein n=1 Tax=Coccidioides posadasii (strain C735) TaxID=222929 RepID=C5P039_COCP7|nr:hypothetical protein CPC735_073660 [Coccidioides posadasii C735 delta SOWgp]EER29684.1 hypothetical protein CPC735_073660 [Coccidioides posadasii C735 delta SOWgp]|eukprot:XP_003071829.1 hypothetical protein CPC735_073660 [Coccidioides posadasii C735 delta SOWgp]
MSSHATPEPPSGSSSIKPNPILIRALSLSLSPREYELIHNSLVKRLPPKLKGRTISPDTVTAIAESRDQYTTEAFRSSLRVFLVTGAIGNIAEILAKLLQKNPQTAPKGTIFRLSLSHSLFVLANRLLYRFFSRLRANLRTEDARPFRKRNPRIAKALTCKYTPAIGASLACFILGLYPRAQLRITAAIYTTTRALEFVYNALREKGWFRNKPWWVGSWLLMPLSCAQLFHAFTFDRETIPKWFGDFILRFSPGYIQDRPEGFPTELRWPDKYETVDALAKISELKWPTSSGVIIIVRSPPSENPVMPHCVSPAKSPLHPPPCAFRQQVHPIASINALSRKILSWTAVLSAAIGSAWGSICFFNGVLPRSVLRTQRFYLSGALAGAPFMFFGAAGYRSHFLYFFRLAIASAWKAGVKRGLWRGWKGGELWVLAVSWAVIGAVLESHPNAIAGPGFRKALAWIRGDGYTDLAELRAKKKGKKPAVE